jgi:hypothetical protein
MLKATIIETTASIDWRHDSLCGQRDSSLNDSVHERLDFDASELFTSLRDGDRDRVQ